VDGDGREERSNREDEEQAVLPEGCPSDGAGDEDTTATSTVNSNPNAARPDARDFLV